MHPVAIYFLFFVCSDWNMSEHEFLLERFACIDEAGENEVLEKDGDNDLFFTVLILQRWNYEYSDN